MTKQTQLIIIAIGDKIAAIETAMESMTDGIEWRLAKAELAEYQQLLLDTFHKAA